MKKFQRCSAIVGLLFLCLGVSLKSQAQDPNTSIWISASVDEDSVSLGSQVAISLTIQKDSSLAATSVQVTNILGTGLTYLSHTAPSNTSFNSATGVWSIDSALYDPTINTLTLILMVEANSLGVMTSVASITQTDQINITQKDTVASTCVSVPIVICEGDSVELIAPPNLDSYQWYKDNELIVGATDSTLVTGSSGSYRFTTTTTLGCESGNCCPIYIIVNPQPTAAIAGNLTICPDGSTTLTASGGTSYLWSTGDTTAAVTLNPAVTTEYYVVASNGSCVDTAFVTISVNPEITASIAGELILCPGGSTTLTVSGGTSYLWSTGDTTAAVTLNPAVTTEYYVVANNGSCVDTAFVTVTVNPEITASISGDTLLCPGGSTTLTATGGTSFLWSTGDTTAAVTLSPLVTTEYFVLVSNGSCVDTAFVTVTVNPEITASISGDTLLCPGGSTTLTASGGTLYLWSTGDTTAAVTLSPLVTTEYFVLVSSGSCVDTAFVTVTVNPAITASISGDTLLCSGGSTVLTASGGTSFLWSTGDTTAAVTLNPAVTTEYYVVVSNGSCVDTAFVTLTVNPEIAASISGDTTLCASGSTTLTASGGTSYLWSTGDTTAAVTLSPLVTTEYFVLVSSGSCVDTAFVTLTVNPEITASISGDTTLCPGGSTVLTASGGTSFLWSTGDTTAAVTLNPIVTTQYFVLVSNGSCVDTAFVTVTVNSEITASISGDTLLCSGGSTVLTASGGTSFLWSTGDTTAAVTLNPAVTTEYYVVVSNGSCVDTAFVTLTVNPEITASISGDTTLCASGSTTLTATGGTSFLWSTGDTTAAVTLNPAVTTEYYVVVSNGSCVDTAFVTLTVNPEITASISGDTTLCASGSTTLTATGGTSFLWSTGDTTAAVTLSPLVTTEYFVLVSNGSCVDTAFVTISVNPEITASISGDTTLCPGGSTTLTATGGTSFLWSTGDTTAAVTLNPIVTTQYFVLVSNGSCVDTAFVTVTVNPAITASISGDTLLCSGGSTVLTASGGTSFLWSTGDTTAAVTLSPLVTTEYFVLVSNGSCVDTAFVTVTVNPAITASISGDTTLCPGGSTVLTASGGTSFLWSTGDTTVAVTLNPIVTTEYFVLVSNGSCVDTTFVTVTVNPEITASISGDTLICPGGGTTLTASGGTSYLWSTGDTTAAVTLNPNVTTEYFVLVSNGSCVDTAFVTISVNPAITASISGDTTLCLGVSTVLTASGGTSYLWSTSDTTADITLSPLVTTEYFVLVSNGSCVDTAFVTISVNPAITASISGDTTLCSGGSTTLTASGGTSFLWSTGDTTAAVTLNPIVTTEYFVLVSSGSCVDTAFVTLTVNPEITASISGDTTLCPSGSTVLTASGGTSFLWSTGDTTAAVTLNPAVTTDYFVVASNGSCVDTAFVTVTVNPAITASISGDTLLCPGGSTTLTASGGTSYLWSTGDTTAAVTLSPLVTTQYFVLVSNGSCVDTAFVTVTVSPALLFTVTTECNNNDTPNDNSDDTFTFTLTPAGGSGTTYSLSGDVTTNELSFGQTYQSTSFLIAAGALTLIITDDTTQCTQTIQILPPTNCSSCPPQICVPVTIVRKRR